MPASRPPDDRSADAADAADGPARADPAPDEPTPADSARDDVDLRAHGADPDDPFGPLMRESLQARPVWARLVYAVVGLLAMVGGVVGWLVPIVTGVPFYILGLICLAKASPWLEHQINRLDRRLPVSWRRALRWRPGWWKRLAALRRARRMARRRDADAAALDEGASSGEGCDG